MMAIEIIGAVYCPLSPQDPEHRLHALVEETRSRLVLIDHATKDKFVDTIVSLDIESVLTGVDVQREVNVDRLSSVKILPENIAYTIFTSGSSGTPKAVCSYIIIFQIYC